MDSSIKKLIEKAKKDASILAIAFFGSFARKEKNYRDIDLCLFLVPQKYSPLELSQKKLEYGQEDEKYDVQIFQQLPLYVQKKILGEAKFIYCKDEDLLYDLHFQTLDAFELYRPIYEDYLGAVAHG